MPGCTVGSRQAEHISQGVDRRGQYGNEVGNSLRNKRERRTDKGGRAASPRDHIRRCQGLAEGWPWQPPKDPLQVP